MADDQTTAAASDSAAADKAAADEQARVRAEQQKAGAVEGATSVAEAVRRVADAAVAAVQKAPVTGASSDFHVTGTPGGSIQLDASSTGAFGASGTVKLNGAQIHTREWSSQRIVGDLPAGSTSGMVEVALDADTIRRGYLTV